MPSIVSNTGCKLRVDLPSEPLTAGGCLPEPLQQQLRQVCIRFVPKWKNLDDKSTFAFKVICGGLTNSLFRVRHESFNVIVRVFGGCTESFIDRQRERELTAELIKIGVGKIIYGEFSNGRVEEWLSGRSLEPEELYAREVFPQVAQRLGEMHALRPTTPNLDPNEATVWSGLKNFIAQALQLQFTDPRKALQLASNRLSDMKNELVHLQVFLLSKHPSPIVLAHNDLLGGNIVRLDSNEIQFIDFEYSSYNYRAFDIANHFCEMCGFECDWEKYPSKEVQLRWLRSYLSGFNSCTEAEVASEDIETLYMEVRPWVLLSHLYWAFWAVVQADTSPIDFDFLSYSVERFRAYVHHKASMQDVEVAINALKAKQSTNGQQ